MIKVIWPKKKWNNIKILKLKYKINVYFYLLFFCRQNLLSNEKNWINTLFNILKNKFNVIMPRRRSSSRSSASSVEIIEKRSSNKFKDRSRSSSTSSRESIRRFKKSSYRSKKSRSRSPKYAGPTNKILELDKERTKNYDFTDEVNGKKNNFL